MRRRYKKRACINIREQDLTFRPIPDINVPTLPRPHLSFGEDGRAQAAPSEATLLATKSAKARGKERATAPELDNRPYEKEVSKRQKAKVSLVVPPRARCKADA